MSKRTTLVKGTCILTITSIINRILGFLYRIYLCRILGSENMGLYQLIFPLYALGISCSSAGVETALSRLISQSVAQKNKEETTKLLFSGFRISFTLSVIIMLLIQRNAAWISSSILHDLRCVSPLMILSYIFPFASIHSCCCGFYLGKKQTHYIAISQLLEQLTRVFSVYLISTLIFKKKVPIAVTFIGLVLGEIISSLYCIYTIKKSSSITSFFKFHFSSPANTGKLIKLSLPLAANRIFLNILQNLEAVSIPRHLQFYGYTRTTALENYGTLTGMSLPFIMFPSAIASSVATMLLPTVAEMQLENSHNSLKSVIQKTALLSFTFGCFCSFCFLLFGKWIGALFFHSNSAGQYIQTLAWLCPFLYSNIILLSILNGLGKTLHSFLINISGLLLRVFSIFYFIPSFGMKGYLWGLLASQCFIHFFSLFSIKHSLQKTAFTLKK